MLTGDAGIPPQVLVRLAAAARLVACFAVLPAMRHGVSGLAQALPLLFAIYGGLLYWRAVSRPEGAERALFHWIDALWLLALAVVSGGSRSPFVLFLLFPVLFVSFRHGFASGMAMAAVAAIALPLSELRLAKGDVDLASALVPSAALLVLGYLIAGWAASGLRLSRRLALLRGLTEEFSPRLAPEQWVERAVGRLLTLFPIDHCLLLHDGRLLEAPCGRRTVGTLQALPEALADDLSPRLQCLALPWHWNARRSWRFPLPRRSGPRADTGEALADLLQCLSVCAVAIPLRDGAQARLFLSARRRRFDADDLAFFQQMAQQLGPRVASASLVDGLAAQVAEYERQRISRDLHDSAVQPYLGLKFALEALARKVPAEDPVAQELDRLIAMTATEVGALRRYVKSLRGVGERGAAALVPALRRHAERFGDLYGIRVNVLAAEDLAIGDDLADQAFHMIGEALSNVRRHTRASRARIELDSDGRHFSFRVSNPSPEGPPRPFVPRSIAERARALGGSCRVERGEGGDTLVVVEVPLAGMSAAA